MVGCQQNRTKRRLVMADILHIRFGYQNKDGIYWSHGRQCRLCCRMPGTGFYYSQAWDWRGNLEKNRWKRLLALCFLIGLCGSQRRQAGLNPTVFGSVARTGKAKAPRTEASGLSIWCIFLLVSVQSAYPSSSWDEIMPQLMILARLL